MTRGSKLWLFLIIVGMIGLSFIWVLNKKIHQPSTMEQPEVFTAISTNATSVAPVEVTFVIVPITVIPGTPNATEIVIAQTARAMLPDIHENPIPTAILSPPNTSTQSPVIWDFVLGGLFVLLVMACFLLWVTLKSDQRKDMP